MITFLAFAKVLITLVIGPEPQFVGTLEPNRLPNYPCILQSWRKARNVDPSVPGADVLWAHYDGKTPPWWSNNGYRTNIWKAPAQLPVDRDIESDGPIALQHLKDVTIDRLVVKSSYWAAVSMMNCRNVTIKELILSGPGIFDQTGRGYGVIASGCVGLRFGSIKTTGCRVSLRLNACRNVLVDLISFPYVDAGESTAFTVQCWSDLVQIRKVDWVGRPADVGNRFFGQINNVSWEGRCGPNVKVPAGPIRVNQPPVFEVAQ